MSALIIASLTAICMILSVLFKPQIAIGRLKLGLYWIICLIGAIFMLLLGNVPLGFLWERLTLNASINPIKILVLFISMTLLSIYLGDAGFFYLVANKVFGKGRGGQLKVFLALYFAVAILTVFTSNDVIILTLTPPICIFAKRAKISPLPYLVGEFVCANTWSTMLIIGNPTNVYLAGSYGISFAKYFAVMWLPAIVCGITSLIILLLLFRKQLSKEIPNTNDEQAKPIDKPRTIVAVTHLLVCLILLVVCDFIGVEMWLVCLVLCVSLTLFNIIYGLVKERHVIKVCLTLAKAPYELIPFIISMFVLVCGLEKSGVTLSTSKLLTTNTPFDGIIYGFTSSLTANLLNNIPMSVLFSSILSGGNAYALYGAVIGSNIGAFITPVGALAGIMWNRILGDYEIKLPFYKFVLYGLAVALPSLALSCLSLIITV